MFSEPEFGASQSILFAAMKHALVVGFLSAEQVVHDARQLVRCSGSRLRLAKLACNAPKELTEVILSVMEGMSAHAKRSGNAAPDSPALRVENLAATDLLFRTQSQPGRECGRVSEP